MLLGRGRGRGRPGDPEFESRAARGRAAVARALLAASLNKPRQAPLASPPLPPSSFLSGLRGTGSRHAEPQARPLGLVSAARGREPRLPGRRACQASRCRPGPSQPLKDFCRRGGRQKARSLHAGRAWVVHVLPGSPRYRRDRGPRVRPHRQVVHYRGARGGQGSFHHRPAGGSEGLSFGSKRLDQQSLTGP